MNSCPFYFQVGQCIIAFMTQILFSFN
jgi:hypothetical protein